MDCSLNLLYQIHMLYFFFLLRIVLGFFSDPKLGFLFEELRKHKTELQTRNTNSPPSDEQSKVRYPERGRNPLYIYSFNHQQFTNMNLIFLKHYRHSYFSCEI